MAFGRKNRRGRNNSSCNHWACNSDGTFRSGGYCRPTDPSHTDMCSYFRHYNQCSGCSDSCAWANNYGYCDIGVSDGDGYCAKNPADPKCAMGDIKWER